MSFLQNYHRRPKFYYTLPSKSYFNDLDKNSLSVLNEVGVSALTLTHQLGLNNPEKLFNGSIIEEIINDCTTINGISPRDLLKCDVDFLLVGIKIASSGAHEKQTIICPKCKTPHEYDINIEKMINNASTHSSSYYVDIEVGINQEDRNKVDRLRVYMRPSTLGEAMIIEHETFNDTKSIQQIYKSIKDMGDEEVTPEEEVALLGRVNTLMEQMTLKIIDVYANSVLRIIVLDDNGNETIQQETDREAIREFIIQSPSYPEIRDKLAEINAIGIDNIYHLECGHEDCGEKFDYQYEVNLSDFFGKDSEQV